MSIGPAPICVECSRFHGEKADPFAPLTCDAFPDGIPDEILESTADHRKAYPGDHGLHFDAIEPAREGKISGNPLLNP